MISFDHSLEGIERGREIASFDWRQTATVFETAQCFVDRNLCGDSLG